MNPSKLIKIGLRGALAFALTMTSATTVLGQTRNGDPRSGEGRYLDSPIDPSELQPSPQDREDRALKEEGARLAKYESWLEGQYKELGQKEGALAKKMKSWSQRFEAWRCPHGLSIYACGCGAASRVLPIFKEEYDRQQSEYRNLRVARSRLAGLKRSYDQQSRAYKVRLKASRNPAGGRSKRSPEEGLFIDESAPRRP